MITTRENQDGGAKKTKCMSSNDRTHASINHNVTFLTVAPRIFLFIYLYTTYLGEYFHIYVVLGHCPVTNSSGTHLKLNYNFNLCKTVFLKILRSLKGLNTLQEN